MAERKLRSVKAKSEPVRPPDLREAVADALAAMTWLKPTDDAIKALALHFAAAIADSVDMAEEYEVLRRELIDDTSAYKRLKALEDKCNATKNIGWLGPLLQGALKEMAGTPASRKAMKSDQPIGGSLGSIRARAAGIAGQDNP
jgi:hypothetical protein